MSAWPWRALGLAPLDWWDWHADGHEYARIDQEWIALDGLRS
jgi:hypothetical protein